MLRHLMAVGLFVAGAMPLPLSAAGFGWRVHSFSWSSFTNALPDMEKDLAGRLERKEGHTETDSALLFESYIVDTFFNVPAPFGAVEESPAETGFYPPRALHAAYVRLAKKNKSTLLRYFDTGKPVAGQPQRLNCINRRSPAWGHCRTVVLFDPDEVKALAKEVASLSPSFDTADALALGLLHFDGVLRKAVAEKRALMFSTQD